METLSKIRANGQMADAVRRSSDVHRMLAALVMRESGMLPEEAAVAVLHAANPRARNPEMVKIGANTSARRSYICTIYGKEFGRCSAKWRRTVRSYDEQEVHEAMELRKINRLATLIQ